MFLFKLSCLKSKDVSLPSKIQHNRKDLSMAQFEYRNHFHNSNVFAAVLVSKFKQFLLDNIYIRFGTKLY